MNELYIYGIFILLLIFLIITLLFMIRWMNINFNKIKTTTKELKNNIPDPQAENVEKLLILNGNIKNCLKDILIDIDADWVYLWQFHNGIHGLGIGRIPFLFLAITHEICKNPDDKTLTAFDQLPLSLYGEFLSLMKNQEVFYFQEYLDKNSSIYKLVMSIGAKSALFRTIRDKDNQIIGFVSALWKNDFLTMGENKLSFINGCQRMAAVLATEIKQESK
jgi:hypothetical protein